jgi:hypothetical protein
LIEFDPCREGLCAAVSCTGDLAACAPGRLPPDFQSVSIFGGGITQQVVIDTVGEEGIPARERFELIAITYERRYSQTRLDFCDSLGASAVTTTFTVGPLTLRPAVRAGLTLRPSDFYLRLPRVETWAGTIAPVRVVLDFDHLPPATPTTMVKGWTYAICHDATALEPVRARPGTNTASLHGGAGPDYFAVQLPDDLPAGQRTGVTVAVVVDTETPFEYLPAQNGWEDAVIEYAARGTGGACVPEANPVETALEACTNALGDPPVRCAMSVPGGTILLGDWGRGTVTIRCPAGYVRGDANQDGGLDISDAACALIALFGPPGSECRAAVESCADAADANDDGSLDIADPIALLGRLFGGGGPLPPPGSSCGHDPTEDTMACRDYPDCAR